MGSHAVGLVRCWPDDQVLCRQTLVISNFNSLCHIRYNVAPKTMRACSNNFSHLLQASTEKHPSCSQFCCIYSVPVDLEEQSLSGSPDIQDDETDLLDPAKKLDKPLSSDQLKSLLADSERAKLVKKLCEANQQNRFLKRQLQGKEDALINFKSELAVLEQEIQALVALADEIAKAGIPEGSRKINGKYIHTHLLSRLEAVQQKLMDQIKDVDAAQSKEVAVFWVGMAEVWFFGKTVHVPSH